MILHMLKLHQYFVILINIKTNALYTCDAHDLYTLLLYMCLHVAPTLYTRTIGW